MISPARALKMPFVCHGNMNFLVEINSDLGYNDNSHHIFDIIVCDMIVRILTTSKR
jgi:hypothetical protein